MKVDQLQALRQNREIKEEMLAAIRMAGHICTQRSQLELVKSIKQQLPDFFGFEAVGLMLRDQKTDLIFTINELSKEENLRRLDEDEESQRAAGSFRGTRTITFPNNLGATGEVF